MARVLFALFKTDTQARAALEALEERAPKNGRIEEIQLHDGEEITHQMRLAETEARRGLAIGLGIGAIGGAVAGSLIAAPLEMPTLVSMLLNGTLGAALGAVGGAIVGAAEPRRQLVELAETDNSGEVVLSIRTSDRPTTNKVRRILKRLDALKMHDVAAGKLSSDYAFAGNPSAGPMRRKS